MITWTAENETDLKAISDSGIHYEIIHTPELANGSWSLKVNGNHQLSNNDIECLISMSDCMDSYNSFMTASVIDADKETSEKLMEITSFIEITLLNTGLPQSQIDEFHEIYHICREALKKRKIDFPSTQYH